MHAKAIRRRLILAVSVAKRMVPGVTLATAQASCPDKPISRLARVGVTPLTLTGRTGQG